MKPYYQDDACTIYHGDCRSMFQRVSYNSLITDPPYGSNYYDSDTGSLTPELLFKFQSGEAPVAIFGWPEWLVQLCVLGKCVPDEWITWWPSNARQRGFNRSGLWREVECIAVFGFGIEWGRLRQARVVTTTPMPGRDRRIKDFDEAKDARMGDVWLDESPNQNPRQAGRRLHPNEKSLPLIKRLVTVMTDQGDTVLDPFMGSGTTLRAAKDLGRKAIGIEIEERYCEIAARRLSQEVLALWRSR